MTTSGTYTAFQQATLKAWNSALDRGYVGQDVKHNQQLAPGLHLIITFTTRLEKRVTSLKLIITSIPLWQSVSPCGYIVYNMCIFAAAPL